MLVSGWDGSWTLIGCTFMRWLCRITLWVFMFVPSHLISSRSRLCSLPLKIMFRVLDCLLYLAGRNRWWSGDPVVKLWAFSEGFDHMLNDSLTWTRFHSHFSWKPDAAEELKILRLYVCSVPNSASIIELTSSSYSTAMSGFFPFCI